MRTLLTVLLLTLSLAPALADEVHLDHDGLTLSANLEKGGEAWSSGPVILMTHGTLAHNKMEIMATLQELFKERGISSLAINLSLGLSNRSGMYECTTPHTHKHTDAVEEIGLWHQWLKGQGVKSVVLLGHSRGGNQTARYAQAQDDNSIRAAVLLAPQTWDRKAANHDYKERYKKRLKPLLGKAKKLVAAGKGEEMIQPIDFLYCPQTAATAEAFLSYYAPDPLMDTPRVITKIHKPLLVFVGSEDKVVKGLAKKMVPLAERDNITFTQIDMADHFFRDLFAEEVADEIESFISELN